MEKSQIKVKEFDEARGWETNWNIKDLCLNINEEIGELWHLIKWVDDDTQKKVIAENHEEAEDFIGDILFLVLKIANQMNIDAEVALDKILNEFDRRMPAEKMKEGLHANKKAGGYDNKNAED